MNQWIWLDNYKYVFHRVPRDKVRHFDMDLVSIKYELKKSGKIYYVVNFFFLNSESM